MIPKLYGTPTSPFVRKVRVLIKVKNLAVEWVEADPWPAESPLLAANPYAKVPALEYAPGHFLFDSPLILHYLDHVDGRSVMPGGSADYWNAQIWQTAGHNLIEAAVAWVFETRRPEDRQMPDKLERELGRIRRGVAWAEQRYAGGDYLVGDQITLGDIALGVALQYLDFRISYDWRADAPRLRDWARGIHLRPAFADTLPPGFTPVTE